MRRLNDQRGATIVIVSISMVLLIGMAAFVIDVAAVYQERRELQNGADASAFAIAEDCARGLPCTIGAAGATAATYAAANATDDAAGAVVATDDFDPAGRVTVRTSTAGPDGSTAISFLFAPALDLLSGKTVTASATAIWGAPSSLRTIPLAISACEWNRETAGGTVYRSSPYDIGDEVTIMFHDGRGTDDCAAVAGMDSNGDGKLPGGFGWLVPDGSCEVLTSAVGTTDWAAGDPGVNPECGAASLAALLGTVVAVPIFDDFCKNNAAGCPTFVQGDKYEVGRYAALYLTGYDLGGPQYERFDPAYRSAAPDCGTQSQADNCITGFFTTDVVDGGDLGGPNGGVFVIRLID